MLPKTQGWSCRVYSGGSIIVCKHNIILAFILAFILLIEKECSRAFLYTKNYKINMKVLVLRTLVSSKSNPLVPWVEKTSTYHAKKL